MHFGELFRRAQQASCNETLRGTVCSRHNPSSAADEGLAHISRFVESFEAPKEDLWLVGGVPHVAGLFWTNA